MSSSPATTDRSRDLGWMALIMLVGLFLRTVAIGHETLWGDEATAIALGRLSIGDLFLRPVESNPGLYFWLHGRLLPLGWGPGGQRLVALVAGMLTIPAVYALGRAWRGSAVGLAAAALAAGDFMLVDFSQEARPYSLLVLLTSSSAAALTAALRRMARNERPDRWLTLFWLTGALGAETQLVDWFWFGPAMLVALVALWRQNPRCWPLIAALLIPFVVQLGIEGHRALLFNAAPVNSIKWIRQPSFGRAMGMVVELFVPLKLWRWAKHELALAGAIALFAALAGILAYLVRRTRTAAVATGGWTWLPLAILLLIPLELWLVGEAATPMAMSRTFLPATPALLVLIAAFLLNRGGWPAVLLLAIVYLADTAATGFVRKKERWDTVVALVRANRAPAEAIAICPAWRSTSLTYQLSLGGPLPPIYATSGTAMVRLDPPPGRDWAEQYNAVWKIPTAPAYLGRVSPPRAALRPAGSMLVLIGDCNPDERALLDRWLRAGRWTELGRVPDGRKRQFVLSRVQP